MNTILWVVVAVVVIGIIFYLLKGKGPKKKEGGEGPIPPQGPPAAPGGPTM